MVVRLSDDTLWCDAFIAEGAFCAKFPNKHVSEAEGTSMGKECKKLLVKVVRAVDGVVFQEAFSGERLGAFGTAETGGVVGVVDDFKDKLVSDGVATLDAGAENGVL